MPNYNKCLKNIDVWLDDFRSSLKLSVDQWNGSTSVNDVFDQEAQYKFKTMEDRLAFRLETWVQVCRVKDVMGVMLTNGGLSKARSFSISSPANMNSFATSCESLPTNSTVRKHFVDGYKAPAMTTSYSTNDLNIHLHEITCPPIDISDPSSTSTSEGEKGVITKPYKLSNLTCRFFPFGKRLTREKSKRESGEAKRSVAKKQKAMTLTNRKKGKRGSNQSEQGYFAAGNERCNASLPSYYSDKKKTQFGTVREELSEGEDVILHRPLAKYRPSLFDMETLRGSLSNLTATQRTHAITKSIGNYEGRNLRANKFMTFSGRNDVLFCRDHMDSVRYLTQARCKLTVKTTSREATPNEADLGSI